MNNRTNKLTEHQIKQILNTIELLFPVIINDINFIIENHNNTLAVNDVNEKRIGCEKRIKSLLQKCKELPNFISHLENKKDFILKAQKALDSIEKHSAIISSNNLSSDILQKLKEQMNTFLISDEALEIIINMEFDDAEQPEQPEVTSADAMMTDEEPEMSDDAPEMSDDEQEMSDDDEQDGSYANHMEQLIDEEFAKEINPHGVVAENAQKEYVAFKIETEANKLITVYTEKNLLKDVFPKMAHKLYTLESTVNEKTAIESINYFDGKESYSYNDTDKNYIVKAYKKAAESNKDNIFKDCLHPKNFVFEAVSDLKGEETGLYLLVPYQARIKNSHRTVKVIEFNKDTMKLVYSDPDINTKKNISLNLKPLNLSEKAITELSSIEELNDGEILLPRWVTNSCKNLSQLSSGEPTKRKASNEAGLRTLKKSKVDSSLTDNIKVLIDDIDNLQNFINFLPASQKTKIEEKQVKLQEKINELKKLLAELKEYCFSLNQAAFTEIDAIIKKSLTPEVKDMITKEIATTGAQTVDGVEFLLYLQTINEITQEDFSNFNNKLIKVIITGKKDERHSTFAQYNKYLDNLGPTRIIHLRNFVNSSGLIAVHKGTTTLFDPEKNPRLSAEYELISARKFVVPKKGCKSIISTLLDTNVTTTKLVEFIAGDSLTKMTMRKSDLEKIFPYLATKIYTPESTRDYKEVITHIDQLSEIEIPPGHAPSYKALFPAVVKKLTPDNTVPNDIFKDYAHEDNFIYIKAANEDYIPGNLHLLNNRKFLDKKISSRVITITSIENNILKCTLKDTGRSIGKPGKKTAQLDLSLLVDLPKEIHDKLIQSINTEITIPFWVFNLLKQNKRTTSNVAERVQQSADAINSSKRRRTATATVIPEEQVFVDKTTSNQVVIPVLPIEQTKAADTSTTSGTTVYRNVITISPNPIVNNIDTNVFTELKNMTETLSKVESDPINADSISKINNLKVSSFEDKLRKINSATITPEQYVLLVNAKNTAIFS